MVSTMDNKVAIVTGAASGIGLAIAQELAMRGVLVTLSDIDEKKGNEAAAELPAARFQFANMTSENDCQRLVADTIVTKGHVDILVNNAGIQHVAPITEFPMSKWHEIITLFAHPMYEQRSWRNRLLPRQRFTVYQNLKW